MDPAISFPPTVLLSLSRRFFLHRVAPDGCLHGNPHGRGAALWPRRRTNKTRKSGIGPSTSLPLLGILLDTINQEAKLPDDKLASLLSELAEFKTRAMIKQTSSKRNLLSLISNLSFTYKVVPAGRIFFRCLLNNMAHSVQHLDDQVHITSDALFDLKINGGSNLPPP